MANVELTEAEARARLQRMVSADCEPTLSDVEVDDLLVLAKRTDQYGVEPRYAASWTPTWELNAVAAEGWRTKMGKAASATDFSMDGVSYTRDQLLAHCERMVAQYEGRISRRDGGPIVTDYGDLVGNL